MISNNNEIEISLLVKFGKRIDIENTVFHTAFEYFLSDLSKINHDKTTLFLRAFLCRM